MRLTTAFRVSTYLSLALATACLGYTERLHLQGMHPFYYALEVLILVAFFAESRYEMPASVANLVAVVIFFAWVGWLWVSWTLGGGLGEIDPDIIRWALPHMGPLLGILLLAKLFRPKRTSDYWLLHVLALVQIALACVLDRDLIFGLLLLAYLVTAIWSMMVFHLHRERTSCTVPVPALAASYQALEATTRVPWRWHGVGHTAGWAFLALFGGLILFFMVPRTGQSSSSALLIPGNRTLTGFNASMNLNEVGPIQASDELVMRVVAVDENKEQVSLSAEQRWRGVTCVEYVNGLWRPHAPQSYREKLPSEWLELEPGQVRLTIQLNHAQIAPGLSHATARGELVSVPLFLADPVQYGDLRGIPYPRAQPARGGRMDVGFRRVDGLVYSAQRAAQTWISYEQVITPALKDENEWAQLTGGAEGWWRVYRSLLLGHFQDDPQRDLQAGALLRRIGVRAAEVLQKAGRTQASDRERGKALARYLSNSSEFRYALERRRTNSGDPTEDFLFNVKEGHCELFASALALMLRSQGIPARVVIGFRGGETSSWGHHEVRQNHAHAWVEALVEEQPVKGPGGENWFYRYWLTLDATPAGEAIAAASELKHTVWDDTVEVARFMWEYFILDYSGDEQRDRLFAKLAELGITSEGGLIQKLTSPSQWTLGGVVLAVGLMAFVVAAPMYLRKRLRRRRATLAATGVPFYAHLLRLLELLGVRTRPGQTPRELGAQASTVLQEQPLTAPVAQVPSEVVARFYDVRFGGQSLDAGASEAVEENLLRLDEAIRAGSPGA